MHCIYQNLDYINTLSANVEYTPHDGDVTCSGCGASYRKFATKWYSPFTLSQLSEIVDRIYTDKKLTFLKSHCRNVFWSFLHLKILNQQGISKMNYFLLNHHQLQ